MKWQESDDEVFENLRARNRLTEFLEKCLQILLGRLLRMKTNFVMMRLTSLREFLGDGEVGLRFSYPRGGELVHTALCLSP